jgi:hypothetical protein
MSKSIFMWLDIFWYTHSFIPSHLHNKSDLHKYVTFEFAYEEPLCKTPNFRRKPESLYHRDTPWISGYRVQNVSQIITQSHTTHHIRSKVHNSLHVHYGVHYYKPLGWIRVRFYAAVASISEGSPSFILLSTGILERSDASLSRTIHRHCCRTRTRTLHTQGLSPRSGIGSRHQLYVALSGLSSKGRKETRKRLWSPKQQ